MMKSIWLDGCLCVNSANMRGESVIFSFLGAVCCAANTNKFPFPEFQCDGLNIVSREEWGANPPCDGGYDYDNYYLKKLFVHHTASSVNWDDCYTTEQCAEYMRNVQEFHQGPDRGWCDVGYNFLIGSNGDVFEGRNFLAQGAHTLGFNDRAYGISFFGDFTTKLPSAEAINSFNRLLECAVDAGYLSSEFQMFGHRQNWKSRTECPGEAFFNALKSYDRFTYGRQATD